MTSPISRASPRPQKRDSPAVRECGLVSRGELVIPISDSPRSSTVPWVTYAIILINVVVFVRMLALSTNTTQTTSGDIRAQTNGICYGLRTSTDDVDRFYCRWAFQPREFFDTVKGQS